MGFLAFMNVPGLQVYVVMLAKRFVPGAVDVASAINIAAFNAGIAIGSYLGGVITDSIGLIHTSWIGALMVLGAAGLTGWSRVMEARDKEDNASHKICA
jgi:predicted MFS family arabinose efflux permease